MTRTESIICAVLSCLLFMAFESAWSTGIRVFDRDFADFRRVYFLELELRRMNSPEFQMVVNDRWLNRTDKLNRRSRAKKKNSNSRREGVGREPLRAASGNGESEKVR